jgi:hypothetical protein
MTLKVGVMLLAAGLVLAGCDGKKDPTQETGGKPSPASLMSSPKLPDPPAAPAAQQGADLPKPDRSVPVANYLDLNNEVAGMALTYIVEAKSQGALSDDDKLNRLSPSYYNETDAFKKKDLAKTELPHVDAALAEYRKHDYYTLPVSAYSQKPLGLTNVSVGQYDFNAKSFPLTSYGQYCWAGTLRNQQGATLKILPSDFPCSLPVADEAQAKLIEAARSQNALGLQGTLYLFVPRAENGTALAVVSRAHIELVNAQTKAPLASFDL